MLRTLSLDAGGVLVRPNWRRIARVLASHGVAVVAERLPAIELEVMREIDSLAYIRSTNDADRIEDFFRRVLERVGVLASSQPCGAAISELKRIHDAENLWEDVPEDVVPALERFKALGLKLVVLSNANGTVRSKLARLGLARWFEHVLDSGEEGIEKPDPRFFALGLQRAGAEPASTIHVGDVFNIDVVGARAAGIRAVLIDRGGLQGDRQCRIYADLGQLAEAVASGLSE